MKEVTGGMDFGLVGVHMKGTLTSKLFTLFRNVSTIAHVRGVGYAKSSFDGSKMNNDAGL